MHKTYTKHAQKHTQNLGNRDLTAVQATVKYE